MGADAVGECLLGEAEVFALGGESCGEVHGGLVGEGCDVDHTGRLFDWIA